MGLPLAAKAVGTRHVGGGVFEDPDEMGRIRGRAPVGRLDAAACRLR